MIVLFLTFPVLVGAAVGGETGGSSGSSGGKLDNPLGPGMNTIADLIKAIANIIFKIGFLVAGIFIILSGMKFVTARGNPEELKKARSMFMWTIIGTAVLLGAIVIVEVIQATIVGLQPGT